MNTDVKPAQNGTKRRGSIEEKTPERNPTDTQGSDEEPSPLPSPTQSRVNKKARQKHRRRNTDTALSYQPNKLFKSGNTNADVIRLMQKELPPSARLAMQKKGAGLKLEREFKHLQIKLRETQDQCNTAVEIIGKLEEEKEDLLRDNDTLRITLGATETEVKILNQKNKSLEDMYRSDTEKYKEEMSSTKKQLSELADDMTQKDMALNQAKQMQQKLEQRLENDEAVDDNGNQTNASKKERQLLESLQKEKQMVLDSNRRIEDLMSQLETAMRAESENQGLQREIDSFAEMAQQDLMMQREQMDKMTGEIIMLGSRNSALEKERDDLMQLLEERDYENQMLKTGFSMHRNKTTNGTQINGIADQLPGGDEEFDDELNLEFMVNKEEPMYGDDIEQYSQSDEYENQRHSMSQTPEQKKQSMPAPPVKEVADVTREYLHLTASVVNMKFPKIQHISSEELINKVKNYQFWEYHEMMVRIMKTEEQKMVAKEKVKAAEQKSAEQSSATQKQSGMLGRFRNFFGGGGGGETRQRNKSASAQQRNKSAGSHRQRAQRGGSTTDKKAPTIGDAKKKLNDLKATAVKKVTNQPSDAEMNKMANMSFGSVPEIGGYHSVGKVKKPDQGL